jgi:Na+/melibiose symporter-like transporter
VFPLLSVFGFDPSAAQNDPAALSALAVSYAWIPILFKCTAIALMWNFPLGREEQARLRRDIESRDASPVRISAGGFSSP